MSFAGDFSKTIKNTVGVGLEREAYKQLGAAVEDFTKGALGSVFKIEPPKQSAGPSEMSTQGVWDPSRYAAAIARGGDLRPRLKFLFKVKFDFDPAILEYLAAICSKDIKALQENLTFTIKSVDKPKMDFEYEEVNMYNFRTKVLKRIAQREQNLTFMDDEPNNVFDFINMYRMALMPIARMSNAAQIHSTLDSYGLEFSTMFNQADTSYRAVLPNNAINVLQKITIYQFYMDGGGGSSNPRLNVKSNKFVFVNPRLTNIDMDDLDHEQGGTFGLATINFDYDALFMESNITTIEDSDSGLQPAHPAGDIMGSSFAGPPEQIRGAEITASPKKNPFIDVLARQGQRAVQESISGALNKKFGGAAGGIFRGAIGAVSAGLGQQAGEALGKIGGSISSAVSRTMAGVATGTNQSIARPASPPTVDNSSGGRDIGRTP